MQKKPLLSGREDYNHKLIIIPRKEEYRKKFIKNKILDYLLPKNLGNYSEKGRVRRKNL